MMGCSSCAPRKYISPSARPRKLLEGASRLDVGQGAETSVIIAVRARGKKDLHPLHQHWRKIRLRAASTGGNGQLIGYRARARLGNGSSEGLREGRDSPTQAQQIRAWSSSVSPSARTRTRDREHHGGARPRPRAGSQGASRGEGRSLSSPGSGLADSADHVSGPPQAFRRAAGNVCCLDRPPLRSRCGQAAHLFDERKKVRSDPEVTGRRCSRSWRSSPTKGGR